MPIDIQDATTAAAMFSATAPQLVRGPHGEELGQFIPTPKPNLTIEDFGVTIEELEREIKDPNTKWYTPEQVMERLREIDRCSP